MKKVNTVSLMGAQIQKLIYHLEKLRVAEYVELMQKPSRILFLNFLAGLARGFGIAVGATIVFALMIEMLRRLIMLNIPGIGTFIAEVVRIVEMKNGGKF